VQTEAGPVTVGTGNGFTVTALLLGVPAAHELVPNTDTFPDVVPKVTVMDVVPAPAVMVAPVGTLHVYPVVLASGSML